jgi:hypothetical protein
MEIKTIIDLIEWSRSLHEQLAQCLSHCAKRHQDERAVMLLEYLTSCETTLADMVADFEGQADPKAAKTYVYDLLPHTPVQVHLECNDHYASLSADEISAEVIDFHEQLIELYRSLMNKAEIPEVEELVQMLLDMELNETKLLVRQIGRMDDL